MALCKNEMLNRVGFGIGESYPRSCPTCKFGPCQREVTRIEGSSFAEDFYVDVVQPAEPRVENKYAVIFTDYIYHPATVGDERSRTNPGHGYPAEPSWNEPVEKIQDFPSEQALTDWIKRNNSSFNPKKYRAIRYQELRVQTEVTVRLG